MTSTRANTINTFAILLIASYQNKIGTFGQFSFEIALLVLHRKPEQLPALSCTQALLSTRTPLVTARRRFKLQQPCRRQTQSLRQAANINQRNIALPTLHAAKVAAGQTTVQSQALLRHALCPAQRRHMLPKTHHGVVRQRRECGLYRGMGGFGSGDSDGVFWHRLSVKNSPLSGYAL
jgi:hypothetical protein